MTDEIKSRILSAETLIPAGVLIALIGPLVACTWWAALTFSGFTNRLASLERAVDGKNSWTVQMEKQTWREFAERNPGVRIPDAQQIHTDWTR